MEYYAGMVPKALEKLTGEERRQIYGKLRLRVRVSVDGSVEASGILRDNLQVLYELTSRCDIENTKHRGLRFNAVLGDGGREVRLEWGTG